MRIDEIEQSAAKNRPLPSYLTTPETCLYVSLRALYESYYAKKITREAAQTEKAKILSQCEEFESEHALWTAACKYYQENIRKAGARLSDMEKSADIFEALSIAAEIIGILTNDKNFSKRITGKFKEKL